ncbi:MAG: hypothetical protein V2A59_00660 [Candidatus Omnitrophota bacterium]
MPSYDLEFILSVHNSNAEFIRNSLSGLGKALEVSQLAQEGQEKGMSFKINISVEDPTIIFDACAQFGRIKSVKVQERS